MLVLERPAIVFVQLERAIRPGVHHDRQRVLHGFVYVLPRGAQRQNRARANVQRQRFEVDSAVNFPSALEAFLRPEIEPQSPGQIQAPPRRAFVGDGRDQNVAAPEKLIAARNRQRIVGMTFLVGTSGTEERT